MPPRALARFVKREIPVNELQPFGPDGSLDTSQTEERAIEAETVELGFNAMKTDRIATACLYDVLHDCDWNDNDDIIRAGLATFWSSCKGRSILLDRFGREEFDLDICCTHVTRRTAPPHHMSLVHMDYPAHFSFDQLYGEWSERWRDILTDDTKESLHRRTLLGVLTVWVATTPVQNYPLWVAAPVPQDECTIYKVGKRERHSVGVYYNERMKWYCFGQMKPFQAWIFDTQHNPHVAVDLGSQGGRQSFEARCLVFC